jgi:metal-dependent amidase/aminoacylase/carboxypeptidase family protein
LFFFSSFIIDFVFPLPLYIVPKHTAGSAVISVTRFHAGEAFNIIPDTAELGGTIRALSDEDMKRLIARAQEVRTSKISCDL